MIPRTLNHTFNAMSVKTANKEGKKYLGKTGTQAWRVSALIEDEWWSAMIYDELLIPQKGKEYHIELSENEGFKNWAYKLKTKKEQILEQTQPEKSTNECCEGGDFDNDHACRKQDGIEKNDAYWDNVNRGKVRHGVACAMLQGQVIPSSGLSKETKIDIEAWVQFIMTGE